MNIVAVLGSPRKESQCNRLALEVARGAESKGYASAVYRINDMDVRGCQACRACKENGVDCIVKDDLQPYWAKLHEADALVVSAPNYASYVCGPMMTYMNRHYCLIDNAWKPRIHPGIKLVGVFSQGRENLQEYLPVYKRYLADFENRDMTLVDILVNSSRRPPEEFDVLMAKAFAIGQSL